MVASGVHPGWTPKRTMNGRYIDGWAYPTLLSGTPSAEKGPSTPQVPGGRRRALVNHGLGLGGSRFSQGSQRLLVPQMPT